MKHIVALGFLTLAVVIPVSAETLPEWFLPLREALYEQELTSEQIMPIYQDVSARARSSLTGARQLIMLSRCEFLMGKSYHYEERNRESIPYFEEGMRLAREALDISPSAEAWQMLSENLSRLCSVKTAAFAIANGLDVEKYAKNALAIDSRNAAAQILIASRWIYAPPPFHNYNKGIKMMSAIPDESNMQKDDEFNVYVAIGYAYMKQKNKAQASEWLLKALTIYPSNKYAQSLLAEL